MTERRSQPWVMYALIAANVAMFGVELANGANPIIPSTQEVVERKALLDAEKRAYANVDERSERATVEIKRLNL